MELKFRLGETPYKENLTCQECFIKDASVETVWLEEAAKNLCQDCREVNNVFRS